MMALSLEAGASALQLIYRMRSTIVLPTSRRFTEEEGIRLAAESHTAAIGLIEFNSQAERIDCEFQRVDGYLFRAPDQKESSLEEVQKAARRAELTETSFVDRAALPFDPAAVFAFLARRGFIH